MPTPPGDARVYSLLSRACAGEWPFDPDQVEYMRHPSLSRRRAVESKFVVIEDNEERARQVIVEMLRQSARLVLHNKRVFHFEIVERTVVDHATEECLCEGQGCLICDGLGVELVPAEGQEVPMMGWVAVVGVH